MSVTPTDDPPRSSDVDPPTSEDSPVHSRVGGAGVSVLERIRSLLTTFVSEDDWDAGASAALLEEPPRPPSIEEFPDRQYPLTYPVRDRSEVNSPDVVAIEIDGHLRLSVPENPGATLISDVWTTIEP